MTAPATTHRNARYYLGALAIGLLAGLMSGMFGVGGGTVIVPLLLTLLVFLYADRITVAGLGRDIATSVGLDHTRVMLIGTGLVAVATGVTTVVVGFLPFLGLVVPNLVSMWRGDNARANLPWVCLGGVAIVVVCDIVGRVIRMPFEVPVSMILGVVGSAVFITLLLRMRARG